MVVAEMLLCPARETLLLIPGGLESSGVWKGDLKPSHELGRP